MMTTPGPTLWARLPAGGWQIGFWVDPGGRTLVDVADSGGSLAYRLGGARRAAPSVEEGWAGCAPSAGGDGQRWALAVGHAPTGRGHLVSFVRLTREGGHDHDQLMLPPEAPSGFWVADDGLWVAAAAGRYTHVRLIAQSATLLHPLRPIAE
jgi:hypothetical protein